MWESIISSRRNAAGGIVTGNGTYPLTGINPYVNISTPGAIIAPVWPDTDPNRYPAPAPVTNAFTVGGTLPTAPDPNENRPPRVNQWSVGIQREITKDFVVDASYVANRGVWEQGATFAPADPRQAQPDSRLYCSQNTVCIPTRERDRPDITIKSRAMSSPAAFVHLPPGNDLDVLLTDTPSQFRGHGQTGSRRLQQLFALSRLSNQHAAAERTLSISAVREHRTFEFPTGRFQINPLQVKVKRLSRGLLAGGAYTWAKGMVRMIPSDFFNPVGNQWNLQQIPPQPH